MKEFTLVVTEQEVNTIGQALGEMPFKLAAPLITKLQNQVNEQLQPEAIVAENPAE